MPAERTIEEMLVSIGDHEARLEVNCLPLVIVAKVKGAAS